MPEMPTTFFCITRMADFVYVQYISYGSKNGKSRGNDKAVIAVANILGSSRGCSHSVGMKTRPLRVVTKFVLVEFKAN